MKRETYILSAVIGDVVGSRFEFNNIKTKDFELVTDESTFTDDTVLTMAVLDWCVNSKDPYNYSERASYLQKWARKYPNSGYGETFIHWKDMDNPNPYNSCGNGSAMRISPVGFLKSTEEDVIKYSKLITEVTHNHPEGIKGAECTARMIFKALNNASKDELYSLAISYYPEIKNLNYEDLKRNYVHGLEICQLTVPQAIYCFLISDSFIDTLRTTISIGGDSDTLAAISCPIALAYYKEIEQDLVDSVKAKLPDEMILLIESVN